MRAWTRDEQQGGGACMGGLVYEGEGEVHVGLLRGNIHMGEHMVWGGSGQQITAGRWAGNPMPGAWSTPPSG